MPLDGATWGAQAAAFAAYAEGDTPEQITPAGGGDPVPFIHDQRADELVVDEATGGRIAATLVVYTRTTITRGEVYSYGGADWTVDSVEPDRAGGTGWPFRVVLVRHAKDSPGF